jgi:hypothetical protein
MRTSLVNLPNATWRAKQYGATLSTLSFDCRGHGGSTASAAALRHGRAQSTVSKVPVEENQRASPDDYPSMPREKIRPVSAISGESILKQTRHKPVPRFSEENALWKDLVLTPDRLAFEANFFDSRRDRWVRLVEQESHSNDASLWLSLLDYCQRRDGLVKGTAHVWRAFKTRPRTLDIWQADAQRLLDRFLYFALNDGQILKEVWQYAEVMHRHSGLQWPRLYATIIPHYIQLQRTEEVISWHKRLSSRQDVTSSQFFEIIKPFLTNDDPTVQVILESLYRVSRHRNLYALILPELHSAGKVLQARRWRDVLLENGEKAVGGPTRHFLRFLRQYYREDNLRIAEVQLARYGGGKVRFDAEERWTPLFELVNRVHGATFGIKEKSFSDELGARLLATSWIPLDLAIRAIAAIGVKHIGPLSLQSIALRVNSAEAVWQKIQQLEELKVGIGESTYSQAIRHFAEASRQDDLHDLVTSDLHPDMFETPEADPSMLGSVSSPATQKALRILVTGRLAVSSISTRMAWNQLLLDASPRTDNARVLQVLDEMQINNMALTPAAVRRFDLELLPQFHRALSSPPTTMRVTTLSYYVALYHRIITSRYMPPRSVLWVLLYAIGRRRRLNVFETLARHIMDQFKPASSSQTTRLLLHTSYDQGRTSQHEESYYPIPEDLPFTHVSHPTWLIFNPRLQQNLIRWGFNWALSGPSPAHTPIYPYLQGQRSAYYYFANGIRILALLRDAGLDVSPRLVRNHTCLRLAELYGESSFMEHRFRLQRRRNQVSLEKAKELCEAAWGQPYLGTLDELDRAIHDYKREVW